MRSLAPRGGAAALSSLLLILSTAGVAAAQTSAATPAAPAKPAKPAAPGAPPASAPAAAPAPTAQQLAAGKTLFAKVVDALGGSAKARTVKDVQTRGQVTAKTPDGEMTMEIQTAMVFPDKLSQQLDAPFGRMAMVATPTTAFVIGPNGSSDLPPQMRDELLKQVQRVPLWLAQKTDDPKLTVAAMGTDKVGDVDASVLDVHYGNMSVRWAIDPKTYRILRSYHTALGPSGNMVKISSDYSDYRSESGFPVAHHLEVTTDGQRDQTLTLEECKINAGVDEKVFVKPPQPTPGPTVPPAEPQAPGT
ncbi:MAG TPA: hypothetical protein VH854_17645 [Thermoanaerobaculia bacterium]|nr:hypothetical protein [Thermoanaerobaculia bacterium]